MNQDAASRSAGVGRDAFGPEWRGLIAVTTCNRDAYLRRCLPAIARATVDYPALSLVVSLDGDDESTREFCNYWDIPLIHSDFREGVGIAKNRVLERFPDFAYYFFLEDDVEVMDASVFIGHIALATAVGLDHMSLFEPRTARMAIGSTTILGQEILHCLYGSADFNFFTRRGLLTVGGWHPEFARYRRWGHTEHSYRFARANLTPAPFNVAVSLAGMCAWHSPPSVTKTAGIRFDDTQIAEPERVLMDSELTYVPLETLGPYHFNDRALGPLTKLASVLDAGEHYPLLTRSECRLAHADRLVWRFRNERSLLRRIIAGAAAGVLSPSNPEWRHEVKAVLR